jgi:hypothetical protein
MLLVLVCILPTQSREPVYNCTLLGRVGIKFPDGQFVPARTAKVYILFASEYVDRGPRDKFFTHRRTVDTAGGLFNYRYNVLLDHDEELKAEKKAPPSDERAIKIAEHALKDEDEAVTQAQDWIAKHPSEAWQLSIITPDEQGLWTADGLRPGSYEIIVRGVVSRMDADWNFSYDLEPGKVYSLESPPRFFRPQEQ